MQINKSLRQSTMMNILGLFDSSSGGQYFSCGEDVTKFKWKEFYPKYGTKKIDLYFNLLTFCQIKRSANVELPMILCRCFWVKREKSQL